MVFFFIICFLSAAGSRALGLPNQDCRSNTCPSVSHICPSVLNRTVFNFHAHNDVLIHLLGQVAQNFDSISSALDRQLVGSAPNMAQYCRSFTSGMHTDLSLARLSSASTDQDLLRRLIRPLTRAHCLATFVQRCFRREMSESTNLRDKVRRLLCLMYGRLSSNASGEPPSQLRFTDIRQVRCHAWTTQRFLQRAQRCLTALKRGMDHSRTCE